MILTRLGNKRSMKNELIREFPPHKMRIEFFFGAGGSFFYLPKPKYSILNDADDDVTNLYLTVINQKEDLIEAIKMMPQSQSLVNHWKNNIETDPIKKALRFLLLSNFTYLGKGDTLRVGLDNTKRVLLKNIDPVFEMIKDAKITNCDFREVVPKISFSKTLITKEQSFGYFDPVYLGTNHWYKVPTWTEKETIDCFEIMAHSGIKCAMSEFDNEIVLDLANDYKMNVILLKERQNINNRRTEILITNYNKSQTSFNF